MSHKLDFTKKREANVFVCIFFSVIFMLCAVPAFMNIGNLALQLGTSVILPIIPSAALRLFFKNSYHIAGVSLRIYILAYLLIGILLQTVAQLKSGTLKYVYVMYYDKPLCVTLCWFSFFVFFIFARLSELKKQSAYKKNADSFFEFVRKTGKSFLIYYTFLMIWFFVFMRTPDSESVNNINIVPFMSLKNYFTQGDSYENFMYLFGNFALFFPYGFFIKIFKPGLNGIFAFFIPIAVSSAIEISQFFLSNGMADVDDVILNCIGFYLGLLVKYSFDKLVFSLSNSKEKTIF